MTKLSTNTVNYGMAIVGPIPTAIESPASYVRFTYGGHSALAGTNIDKANGSMLQAVAERRGKLSG